METNSREFTPVGANVADFFDRLNEIEGREKDGPFNPNGSNFEGMSAADSVKQLISMHPSMLDTLGGRLDNFYQIGTEKEPKELPAAYIEAKEELEKIIEDKKKTGKTSV